MKPSLYGPCGLFCGACGAEDCSGCQSDNVDEYVSGCRFRKCAREKGLEFCCFCPDYPCRELNAFMNNQWPHHWTMRANLQAIRDIGRDAWLNNQKAQWLCKSCGAEIKWYQKKCRCGRELNGWNLPEGIKNE